MADPFRQLMYASLSALLTLPVCVAAPERGQPLIFPTPKTMTATGTGFTLDDQTSIVVPSDASEQDLFLASFLRDEIGDRFARQLRTERVISLNANRRVILIGSIANPLVKAYCGAHKIEVSATNPGPEGYVLRVDSNVVLVAGSDDRGAFYGLQSLRQLAGGTPGEVRFHAVEVRDWPDKTFRGVTLYLPGRNNIPFFKRFVRDFLALYKYNTVIMEMNGSMRLDRHPEVNTGWQDFARDTLYSRRNYPVGTWHGREPNSTHYDTADGGVLEKAEVADLAHWLKLHHIELIPELPSLTHSYYLLSAHKELAEVPGEKWPDTYCPSNPKSYQLLFDVYDEYIDLLKPKMVHAGHDELFMPVGQCPLCKDKDIGERFGEDVKKIHDYLAGKGVKMAIWGDMLLQGVRGTGLRKRTFKDDGTVYYTPGGMTPDQVARLIPKDVLLFNWFWSRWSPERSFEAELDQMGFQQIYGNFTASIRDYDTRRKRATILGGAPSAWFATNEAGFGKELLSDLLGCASILWSSQVIPGKELSATVQAMVPEIRVRWRGEVLPSETEPSVVPLNIAGSLNMADVEKKLDVDLSGAETGAATLGKVSFRMAGSGGNTAILVAAEGKESTGLAKQAIIPVGEDATSLIFLHASAKPAFNRESYRVIWDQDDTADLLGWYEVVYEDGFVISVPIRYGVNIQEWNWDKRTSAQDYCYGADAVPLGGPENNRITFFSYEWTNPRLGKVIKEIRLKGTTGFRGAPRGFTDDYGPPIANNGVILKAISVVKRR